MASKNKNNNYIRKEDQEKLISDNSIMFYINDIYDKIIKELIARGKTSEDEIKEIVDKVKGQNK